MAKDPAFLFYYQDFLVGTDDLTNEEIGAYIRCLCNQASKGSITESHMIKICLRQNVKYAVEKKFVKDKDGNFYNERLREEINKRKIYSESRRINRKNKNKKSDMKNISESYVQHMENENISSIYSLNKEEYSKFTLEHCAEIAMKDDRWVKLNKTNKSELLIFNDYLASIGHNEKTLLDYKGYFSNKKRKNPEFFANKSNNQLKKMLNDYENSTTSR